MGGGCCGARLTTALSYDICLPSVSAQECSACSHRAAIVALEAACGHSSEDVNNAAEKLRACGGAGMTMVTAACCGIESACHLGRLYC